MSNSEQGIFQAQARAANEQLVSKGGLREWQDRSVIYLDERIYVYLLAIGMFGLFLVWVTWKSSLVLYGSLTLPIVLTCPWGYARIRSIDRARRARELQVRTFEANRSARKEIG